MHDDRERIHVTLLRPFRRHVPGPQQFRSRPQEPCEHNKALQIESTHGRRRDGTVLCATPMYRVEAGLVRCLREEGNVRYIYSILIPVQKISVCLSI